MNTDQLEGAFYDYMHQLGQASPEWNRDVLSFYVPLFTNCRRVLDVGCGEGQFIDLLQDKDVEVVGIDSDTRMVEICRRRGFAVVQADLFDYLPQHEGQFDGIFSSNLIEHLSAQDAARFIQTCFRVLPAGGTLLIATPNPASLIVQLHEFWRDATHVRLYSLPLLEFLFHWAGFTDIESGEHPHTVWTPPPSMQELPRALAGIADIGAEHTAEGALPFLTESADRRSRSVRRRLLYSLRRRLAHFFVRNVLFEEFASLQYTLKTLQYASETLYGSHANMLLRARESYARGIKPPTGLAEET